MSVTITPKHGHWEVYIDGKFYCSADSFSEAVMEYTTYMKERNANEIKSLSQGLQYS
jgi:hypothetical protein